MLCLNGSIKDCILKDDKTLLPLHPTSKFSTFQHRRILKTTWSDKRREIEGRHIKHFCVGIHLNSRTTDRKENEHPSHPLNHRYKYPCHKKTVE